jgi:hypothetical protein
MNQHQPVIGQGLQIDLVGIVEQGFRSDVDPRKTSRISARATCFRRGSN